MTTCLGRRVLTTALAILLGCALAGLYRPASASPIEWEQDADEILYEVNFDYFGFENSMAAIQLPRVTVIGRREWEMICIGQDCADFFQGISDAVLTYHLLRLNQLSPEQVAFAMKDPRKDVRCYVGPSGVSAAEAEGIRNTTSQSSNEQKWIAAESMYRYFALTTPRIAQALGREVINGVLAFRVTFADGGSAAYQILSVIPSAISPALSMDPIPNTEQSGSGQPNGSGTPCS